MAYTMEYLIILFVIPAIVTSITVSPNGNSPQVKMVGGMGVDVENGFVPMTPPTFESTTKSNYEKSRKFNNDTKLSLNERYRRLIPYMTFYYANDLAVPTTDSNKNIEVEKAQIVEAKNLESNQRQPKKIIYSSYRQIPRYQGNRLTQYNIASANPTKILYKNGVPIYESPSNVTPFKNPLLPDIHDYDSRRYIHKQIPKAVAPGPFLSSTRKPYINLYNDENPGLRYYLQQKEQAPKYKLVPYEQTPPVKVEPQNENVYEVRKPVIVSVLVPKELYVKPRPVRPPFIFENSNQQIRKQPAIISESYYEKQRPPPVTAEPVVESGFKPIVTPLEYTATPPPIYKSTVAEAPISHYDIEKIPQPFVKPVLLSPHAAQKPEYFQYIVDKPQVKPTKQTVPNTVNLASLLNSLQVNKSIPKPITRDNVSLSIKTLLQVLNALKSGQQPVRVTEPVLSTPKPFVSELPLKTDIAVTKRPVLINAELQEEYLAEVNPPSQHLDDHPSIGSLGGTSQQFPLPVTSDDEGGTPGRPGVDYPVLTTIPRTKFDCKTQRYKGFFADTETRCQVWHYCDLNGGQASFLCPNGTIFSQAGLTCDWWFNVRCDTTTQLYVLNESLYKYILPHAPKFPEDYSGPLVDKYLTLKFKEMEEEFKKNKNKSTTVNEEEDEQETKATDEESSSGEIDKRQLNDLSVSSVIIESPGTSGKVERLIDE